MLDGIPAEHLFSAASYRPKVYSPTMAGFLGEMTHLNIRGQVGLLIEQINARTTHLQAVAFFCAQQISDMDEMKGALEAQLAQLEEARRFCQGWKQDLAQRKGNVASLKKSVAQSKANLPSAIVDRIGQMGAASGSGNFANMFSGAAFRNLKGPSDKPAHSNLTGSSSQLPYSQFSFSSRGAEHHRPLRTVSDPASSLSKVTSRSGTPSVNQAPPAATDVPESNAGQGSLSPLEPESGTSPKPILTLSSDLPEAEDEEVESSDDGLLDDDKLASREKEPGFFE